MLIHWCTQSEKLKFSFIKCHVLSYLLRGIICTVGINTVQAFPGLASLGHLRVSVDSSAASKSFLTRWWISICHSWRKVMSPLKSRHPLPLPNGSANTALWSLSPLPTNQLQMCVPFLSPSLSLWDALCNSLHVGFPHS